MTITELRGKRDAANAAARNIITKAESDAGRDLSESEVKEFDTLIGQRDSLQKKIDRLALTGGSCDDSSKHAWAFDTPTGGDDKRTRKTIDGAVEFHNVRTGDPIRGYRGKPQFAAELLENVPQRDVLLDPSFPALGHALVHIASEGRRAVPREVRDLITSNNISAGYLVQDVLAALFIDRAIPQTVMSQAGATTLRISGDTDIARHTNDLTFVTHSETTQESTVAMNFDRISLRPRTRMALIRVSDELLADAVNGPSIIENILVREAALDLDTMALAGTGSGQPVGLVNLSGVNTIAGVASPTWEDFLDAIELGEEDNINPTAYVIHPNTKNTLAKLLVNSEVSHWAAIPPDVATLRRFVTTAISNANAIVGDFSYALMGIRQDVQIKRESEVARNSQLISVTYRADFNATQATAFTVLSGIS